MKTLSTPLWLLCISGAVMTGMVGGQFLLSSPAECVDSEARRHVSSLRSADRQILDHISIMKLSRLHDAFPMRDMRYRHERLISSFSGVVALVPESVISGRDGWLACGGGFLLSGTGDVLDAETYAELESKGQAHSTDRRLPDLREHPRPDGYEWAIFIPQLSAIALREEAKARDRFARPELKDFARSFRQREALREHVERDAQIALLRDIADELELLSEIQPPPSAPAPR